MQILQQFRWVETLGRRLEAAIAAADACYQHHLEAIWTLLQMQNEEGGRSNLPALVHSEFICAAATFLFEIQ